ncbi:MAG: hypothetical protein AAFN79_12300 [Pseudomonadota bacterium]
MGWTGYARTPRDPAAEVARLCTFETDSRKGAPVKIVKRGSIFYAAVRTTVTAPDGAPRTYQMDKDGAYVFGAVFLTRQDRGEWLYKDMDEGMGPYECGAPVSILDLLSPTTNESALCWRKRCRARAALQSRKVAEGDVIRFAEPLTFTDGSRRDTFRVAIDGFPGCRKRTVFECPETGARYRISAFKTRAWDIVSRGQTDAGAGEAAT